MSTKLDLGLDSDMRSLGAKRLLMTISEDCIIKQENSKILNPDLSPTLADIESVREKIDGYRIINDLHSSDLDLYRSCFSAAAIPTADNNNVVRFRIRRNVQISQLMKVCSILKESMSINQEAEFKNYGCNNGYWWIIDNFPNHLYEKSRRTHLIVTYRFPLLSRFFVAIESGDISGITGINQW